MRGSVLLLLLVMLVSVRCTPAPASAETVPDVALLVSQNLDSLGVVINWTPPDVADNQHPVAGYRIRVVADLVGDTLAASYVTVPTERDTLWMGMPSLGETIRFYAVIQTLDVSGASSPTWGVSNTIVWTTPAAPPDPPGSVNIDTMAGALIIDSLQIITMAGAVDSVEMAVGDTMRFAAVLYSGDLPVQCCCQDITDPIGTHPCDHVDIVDIGGLLPEGQEYVRYTRADAFEVVGDTTKRLRVGMAATGYFKLWRYQLRDRYLNSLKGRPRSVIGT